VSLQQVRAEQRKLKKIIKKEQKGAARELRKDNYFLAEEKAKEVAVFEAGREEKTKQVMTMLQQQESDFNSGGQKGMKLFGKKKK
jgi:nucleolar protein 14